MNRGCGGYSFGCISLCVWWKIRNFTVEKSPSLWYGCYRPYSDCRNRQTVTNLIRRFQSYENYHVRRSGRWKRHTGEADCRKIRNPAHFYRRYFPCKHQKRNRAWQKGKRVYGSGLISAGWADLRSGYGSYSAGWLQKRIRSGWFPTHDSAGRSIGCGINQNRPEDGLCDRCGRTGWKYCKSYGRPQSLLKLRSYLSCGI